MNLFFRLLGIIFGSFRRPRLDITGLSTLTFRVWPLDLDLNLHLTNSRYMSLMDLGRLDLILRSHTWRAMRRGRLGVVLGGTAIRFRRSLAPFKRFTLTSKVLGWDERWIYVEQVFTGPEGVACHAVLRTAFVKAGKIVSPNDALALADRQQPSPALPGWVNQWAEVEAAFAG